MLISLAAVLSISRTNPDLDYLHEVAHEVTLASRVGRGEEIAGVGRNSTGFALRVPGGTQTFYPAFWVRDAAMMLGADLVPAPEVEGWVRVVASTQPGPAGLSFPHGLRIPAFSIPDHVTLKGEACWFPGAYANQGVGDFGFLPPADDAFYFIQMVHEHFRLTHDRSLFKSTVKTGWGDQILATVCRNAFDSVAVDPETGLVVCDPEQDKSRVDWGFCDSIRKSGLCLMPSLLRWQAAKRMAELTGDSSYLERAKAIAKGIQSTFYKPLPGGEGMLLSATGLGRKDDVWASAFAVWLGVLPHKLDLAVSGHLLALYKAGGTVLDGQVRQLPPTGEFGGFWEDAKSSQGAYQNGGYWATPTGWLVSAIRKVDRLAAGKLLAEYVGYVRANRSLGAPFEWINPSTNARSNANYCSSAGLVYISLSQAGF